MRYDKVVFDFLILNAILLLFLLLSLVESEVNFANSLKINQTASRFTGKRLLLIILLTFPLIIFFVLFSPKTIIHYYLLASFSALLIGHALVISLNRTRSWQFVSFLVSGMIIALRLVYPSTFSHNLFLILSIVWLGPFFVNMKILTVKRFILISLIWFAYDIFYVWLTPLVYHIDAATRSVGFPLSIAFGQSWIGTGDLLWANLLISVLKSRIWKLTAVALLLGSNLLLKLFDLYTNSITLFPLLVLWVPVGLVVLQLTTRRDIPSKKAPA